MRVDGGLEELHIERQSGSRLRLLTALPAVAVRAMLLIRWQSVHPWPERMQ
jgi:hypothetical protein